MKTQKLLTAACIAIFASTSNAGPSDAAPAQGQSSLNKYLATTPGTSAAQNLLELATVSQVAASPQNIASVRGVLASNTSESEKISAVRILGAMDTKEDKYAMNSSIASDLKGQIYSGSSGVSRAATLTYSRLAYFPDSIAMLSYAKQHGGLTKDEFAGELAHLLHFAPEHDQIEMIGQISGSGSQYGAEILAGTLDPGRVARLRPGARHALREALVKMEPNFPMAIGQYGLIDSFRYADWLHATALLQDDTTPNGYKTYVLGRLNSTTDARKILAFLSSPQGDALMRSNGNDPTLKLCYTRIAAYADSFPSNHELAERVLRIKQFKAP